MTDTTDKRLAFPREIWMGDRYEHDQGMLHVRAAQDEDHDHRYVDADILDSAEKYWRTRAEAAEAERDALQAKLAVAVEGLRDTLGMLDDPTGGEHVRDMRGASQIIRHTLSKITLTADTPTPDPRIEGWNAAIEAAAKLLRHYAVEKGNTKTGNGRTAIFYARKVEAIPCPYQPKEGKDDE
ncbi:MAG: hypothetical protein Tp118SUR00d2C21406231_30 [Prokaryotic dsDNA virus sp.]|nr:MAG: hypothetical protein Tp125DCM00d2C40298531_49 [Prokaryotic dsDNA virus sp.]QDP53150.1 MAG: hypothetical protein Tp118SUR00d2C21406231_30 [Prokaryotic dsDNA virus sp.]|tara:strand:- start:20262 stop:20807 length:546 start_codon:yes stop_codon:yes gene_type:complete